MFATLENRWWIVVAATLGLVVTYGGVGVFAFAAFLKPVTADLDISRSLLVSGALTAGLTCGIATPLVGLLADRLGCRNVLLVGIPLFSLTTGMLGLLQPSTVIFYILFALTGLFGAAQSTVPYAKVISSWFDRERGLALGIAMCGMGISVILLPQIATKLIEIFNWRLAYVGIGITIFAFAFLPVLLFIREPTPSERAAPKSGTSEGVTAAEAVRSWRFWAIGGGFGLAVVCTQGTLVHAVAILTDRGASIGTATFTLSLTGVGMILGRLICGWCLDRFYGPLVAAFFLVLSAIGIGCFVNSLGNTMALFGALLCGVGLGAHVGLMAFFAGRYFGLRHYGRIYGLMFGLFQIGCGVGPYLSGISYDVFHSYDPALIAFIFVLGVLSFVMLPLGPYRFSAARLTVSVHQQAAANASQRPSIPSAY